jgi:hypothetical protein
MMEALRGIVEKSFEQLGATLGVYLQISWRAVNSDLSFCSPFSYGGFVRIFESANVNCFCPEGVHAML